MALRASFRREARNLLCHDLHHNTAFLEFAHRVALLAGAILPPHFRVALDIEDKGALAATTVTIATMRRIGHPAADWRAYPLTAFAVEPAEKGSSNYTWVIDPIDGKTHHC